MIFRLESKIISFTERGLAPLYLYLPFQKIPGDRNHSLPPVFFKEDPFRSAFRAYSPFNSSNHTVSGSR